MLIKHLKNVYQAFENVNQPVENVKYVWKTVCYVSKRYMQSKYNVIKCLSRI